MKKQHTNNIIHVWTFAFVSIITLGIYPLVWFYNNWKILQAAKQPFIYPFWRALFGIAFAKNLARDLQIFLREKNIPCNYTPGRIGAFYFLITLGWGLNYPYCFVALLSFIPLLPMVHAMNIYWKLEEKKV